MPPLNFINANTGYDAFMRDQGVRRQRRAQDLAAEAKAQTDGLIAEEIARQTRGAQQGPVPPGQHTPDTTQPPPTPGPAPQPAAGPSPTGGNPLRGVNAVPAPVAPGRPVAPAVTAPPTMAAPTGSTASAPVPASPVVPPDINMAISRRLAAAGSRPGAAPGLGAAALNRYDAARKSGLDERAFRANQASIAQKREDAMKKTAITALAAGDMVTFDYFSQRAGLQIPPEVVKDGRVRQLFARGALVAEKFYKDDPTQAQKFVQGYMQNGGDPVGAFNVAGVPRAKPNVKVENIIHGNQQVIALVDTANNKVTIPKDQTGKAYQTPAKATPNSLGKDVGFVEYLRKHVRGPDGRPLSYEGALRVAQMAKTNPYAIVNQIEKNVAELPMMPEQKRAEAKRQTDEFWASYKTYNGMIMAPGTDGAAPAKPAPGIPTYNPKTRKIE